ncbi:porin family protein [Flavobacterium sp. HSC-61S13]|uniref:porin family protein n=1 Tax=Flavobacterium sp. HSC-61S13 TaxID=2910963 RepID=UPI003531BB41|nr:opacity protein-like surface antigen [Flavobacterium sp. HSC-61S13]
MACTLFSGAIYAQTPDVKIGAKAGLNFANFSGGEADTKMKTGFHVGGLVEIFINEKFSIQPELLYSSQGAKLETQRIEMFEGLDQLIGKVDQKMTLDYINVPIMAKYYVAEGFSIQAGPQLGFLVKAESVLKTSASLNGVDIPLPAEYNETEDLKDEVKSVDFGLNFGIGYELPMGIFVDARYNLGLSKLPEDNYGDKVKNAVFQISVGYKF